MPAYFLFYFHFEWEKRGGEEDSCTKLNSMQLGGIQEEVTAGTYATEEWEENEWRKWNIRNDTLRTELCLNKKRWKPSSPWKCIFSLA